jgi:hypothetical protein
VQEERKEEEKTQSQEAIFQTKNKVTRMAPFSPLHTAKLTAESAEGNVGEETMV